MTATSVEPSTIPGGTCSALGGGGATNVPAPLRRMMRPDRCSVSSARSTARSEARWSSIRAVCFGSRSTGSDDRQRRSISPKTRSYSARLVVLIGVVSGLAWVMFLSKVSLCEEQSLIITAPPHECKGELFCHARKVIVKNILTTSWRRVMMVHVTRLHVTMPRPLLPRLLCLALPGQTAMPIQDTLTFGDAASEHGHGLAAEQSRTVTGGLGEPARVLLPRAPASWEGGSVSFTMRVDRSNRTTSPSACGGLRLARTA